ncbi:phage tail fiber protein, partial [Klebsiella michiganensis]
MTRLPESSSWEEEIELISRSERVSGGLDGVANRPLKSLASRTRYLKERGEQSDERLAGKVSAVKTFTEGAILESPREEILYGVYRLVWTGLFPKSIPAGSSPKTTGGIGAGAWAYTSDAVIRQNLSAGEGFKLVGQFPGVVSLAAAAGNNGDRVLVKSYHEGGSEGGGQFVYDESRASENDGVTVFNGWVRQIVNNTLT